MANHDGFIFISKDGEYLQRRVLSSHGPRDKIVWALSNRLDAAYLFPHAAALHNIKSGEGFKELATCLDVPMSQLGTLFTAVPAHSVQRIYIGHEHGPRLGTDS